MPRDSAMTSPLRRWVPWRRHVLALFVLMLLWRGLIPEGFMPNFAALKALRWELVVCGPEWQAATARWQAQLALKAAGGQGAGQGNQLGYGHAGHASALAVAGSSADRVADHFAGHDLASHASHASHAGADQGLASRQGEQARPSQQAPQPLPQRKTRHTSTLSCLMHQQAQRWLPTPMALPMAMRRSTAPLAAPLRWQPCSSSTCRPPARCPTRCARAGWRACRPRRKTRRPRCGCRARRWARALRLRKPARL